MSFAVKIPASKIFALAIVAVIAIGTWFGYSVHEKREQRGAIVERVAEASGQLREALGTGASAGQLQKLGALAADLEALKPGRERALAGAAELYLFSARAIVQRLLDRERNAAQAARAREALAAHMGARQRGEAWIRDAVELKKRVERADYDVEVSNKALVELLETLPGNQKDLEGGVDPSQLLEPALRQAALKQARTQLNASPGAQR